VEEIFYEDILETFLFCFIASMGIIQIMVARRGWHGLSVYGGRVRANVNNALGAALIIFAYAWYFSDPLHRNVRNIEAFMSLACLVLGIIAAGAATALLAAMAEALRRRFGRGRAGRKGRSHHAPESLVLSEGAALLSGIWGDHGENMVVIAEPGRGSQNLIRNLSADLPENHGVLSIHPDQESFGHPLWDHKVAGERVMALIAEVEKERGMDLSGETFLGFGWGGNALELIQADLEGRYRPRQLLIVAPVLPDCDSDLVGDALLSNAPQDIGVSLLRQKPWEGEGFAAIFRLWLPVCVLCIIVATAVTMAFDVRWKLLSGPFVGLLLSLWIAYFLARWRDIGGGKSMESGLALQLCRLVPREAAIPVSAVLTSGDDALLATLPAEAGAAYRDMRLEVWEDVLRGKFVLEQGTKGRLEALIWEGGPETG